jgi:hypothetical protein
MGMPFLVQRRPVVGFATLLVGRKEDVLDVELEEPLTSIRASSRCEVRGPHCLTKTRIIADCGGSGEIELVIPIRQREGMDRVSAVAKQITLLRRRPNEPEEPARMEYGTERMHARSAVAPDGRQIAKRNAEIVEDRAPSGSESRAELFELVPGCHSCT